MQIPAVGDPAPLFELLDDKGEGVSLADLRGARVVLFFYPRADTPGCTIEACEFRDELGTFEAEQAVVLGISPDTVEDQARFKAKFGLTYPLLADADHQVAEAYGVWGTKMFFGQEILGVHRTTFIVDEEGRIQRVFTRVNPEGHAQEVLRALRE